MMKIVSKQTHYTILDIPTGSSPSEISQAYREAVELYQDDSMAAYSFFPNSERKEILARLEEAYLTLIHPKSRSLYDRSLMEMGIMEEENRYQDHSKRVMPIYDIRHKKTLYPWLSKVPSVDQFRGSDNAGGEENASIRDILQQDRLTGRDLKNIRTTLGLTLAQIFQQTRIATGTLAAIEDDRFDLLPPAIYLKNFLKLYAQCLKIDGDSVVLAYMKHMNGDN